jgi:2-oxoisovalerate dehydrogenase E1 component alpha subunit
MAELSAQQRLHLYELMLLARALDERQQRLVPAAAWPLVLSCRGREAAQVGGAAALHAGRDILAASPRSLAAVLTLGVSPAAVLLEALARAAGPWSGGRQLPGHFADRSRRILSCGRDRGTQISRAAGAALASRLRAERAVTLCYFDAADSNGGDFHEALNFAALHHLPVVYLAEQDGWAGRAPFACRSPVDSVARRAAAYGLPAEQIDGSDLDAVHRAAAVAAERARRGDGPSLIEARVARLPAPPRETERRAGPTEPRDATPPADDPLVRCAATLRDAGLLPDQLQEQIVARVVSQVEAATADALAAAEPTARQALPPSGVRVRSAPP